MNTASTTEERLAAVEHAVAELQDQISVVAPTNDWLEKVKGSISDEEAFQKALEYGRTFRDADRPIDHNGEKQ